MRFEMYRYVYIDHKKKVKFEVFARTLEFAEHLIERVNKIGVYHLKHKLFGFARKVLVDTPPYEIEMSQEDYVTRMEEHHEQRVN